jgi:lipopolysaccharide transport protein LptA
MTWTQSRSLAEPFQPSLFDHLAAGGACLTFFVLCALSLTVSAASDPLEFRGSDEEMTFQADSADLDFRNNKSTSYKITMTQGSWTMTADQGSLEWQDDKSGEWRLKGTVRLRGPGSEIDAEEARVTVGSNRIKFVDFIGWPATFRQIDKESETVQGKARSIQYDLNKGLVSLVGNAFINMGRYELTNATIVYDLNQQKATANNPPSSTGRVKGRIKQQDNLK